MIASVLSLLLAAGPLDAPQDYVVEGLRVPLPKLRIERESKQTPPARPDQPVRAEDAFKVLTDWGPSTICYTRFLNRSRGGERHVACPTGDWGLGLPGMNSFWYRGNTLRVVLDGQDIVARYAADSVEVREDVAMARLRFGWKLPEADVAVSVAVVNRRTETLAEVTVAPHRPLKEVGLDLTCYPGGFAPYYGGPSRRVVRTEQSEVSVATGQASAKLPLPASCGWVWYADHDDEDQGRASTGSVALVLLPEEKAGGTVLVSSYGVGTGLRYAGTQSRIRLGLAAYAGPNPRAWRQFEQNRPDVVNLLKTVDFWPGRP